MKRVIVCCPGNCVTGGPELIHQFIDALSTRGVDANVAYYPFNEEFNIPEPYKKYAINVIRLEDIQNDDLVVLPEVATKFVKKFPENNIFIWWLSVDNYFGYKGVNLIKEKLRHYYDIVVGEKVSIARIKGINVINLVQSQYAKDFLLKNGIASHSLTDYLNEEHLEQNVNFKGKEKIIAYNPKKGMKYTQKLISAFGDYKFIPIENMTAIEVRKLLQSSMIYMDFGRHPGKDRFPREAAMAGCCIITGREGSALNDIDVCVPRKYKIDAASESFINDFGGLVDKIFSNFEQCNNEFEEYRTIIVNERFEFNRQVDFFVSQFL
ncbi:hypothetical protein ACK36F_07500 [Aeromonas veronii]